MYAVMGGLVALLVVAIYSALVLAKKTDQTIMKFEGEEEEKEPLVVRFPDEVFHKKETITRS